MFDLVVTRHPALISFLKEKGLIGDQTPVVSHVTEDDVRGKHVLGVLPLRLAASAASVSEIPLDLAPEDRGRELDLARVREIAGDPVTYRVLIGR